MDRAGAEGARRGAPEAAGYLAQISAKISHAISLSKRGRTTASHVEQLFEFLASVLGHLLSGGFRRRS